MEKLYQLVHQRTGISLDDFHRCLEYTSRTHQYPISKIIPILLRAWEEKKLGVIVHWGPYAVPGYLPPLSDKSRKKKVSNGSEWYLRRSRSPFIYGNATRDHHREEWDDRSYYDFIELLEKNASQVNFQEWVDLWKKKGVEYVIITSKHHDGVAMYPSQYSTFSGKVKGKTIAFHNATERDYLKELEHEVRKAGMKLGLYYSLMEWTPRYGNGRSAKKVEDYVEKTMIPQLKEMVERYRPDILWTDGDWEQTADKWKAYDFLDWLFNESPVKETVVINDRWGKGFSGEGRGYRIRKTVSDRHVPSESEEDWEHVNTISASWGYADDQPDDYYKDPAELQRLYGEVIKKGGHYLLNFGPDSYGRLDPREVKIFEETDFS